MKSTAAPSIPNYGGQAVIEGVMMRSRRAMAVAVRHPAGHTVVHVEPLRSARHRSRWARLPLIRGMVLLWDTLVLGMRALAFSANVAAAEDLDPTTLRPPQPHPTARLPRTRLPHRKSRRRCPKGCSGEPWPLPSPWASACSSSYRCYWYARLTR